MIYIIEDDPIMTEILVRYTKKALVIFQQSSPTSSLVSPLDPTPPYPPMFSLKSEDIITFSNAIEAMNILSEEEELPRLIILDVLLTGPNAFTFLNELISYPDLAEIPIIIVSSLNFSQKTLPQYNVVKIFNKTTMLPNQLIDFLVVFFKTNFTNLNNLDEKRFLKGTKNSGIPIKT